MAIGTATLLGLNSSRGPLTLVVISLSAVGTYVAIIVGTRKLRIAPSALLLILFASAVLLPPLPMPGGLPAVRLEFVGVWVTVAVVIGNTAVTGSRFHIPNIWMPRSFVWLAIAMLASVSFAAVVLGSYPIARDFWEFLTVAYYAVTCVVATTLSRSLATTRQGFHIAMLVFGLAAGVALLQHFNIAGINSTLTPIYDSNVHVTDGIIDRVIGTSGNPNEFGAIMIIPALLSFAGVLVFKGKKRGLFACAMCLFAAALIVTLSRTALIALIAGMAFILLWRFLNVAGVQLFVRRTPAVIVISAILAVLLIVMAPDRVINRLSTVSQFSQTTSWVARTENWSGHAATWLASPLFGWGPGKGTMGTIVDNEWLLFLRRYGIAGALVFAVLLARLYRRLGRSLTPRDVVTQPYRVALQLAMQGVLVAYTIYMVTAAVYHVPQIMTVLLLMVSLTLGRIAECHDGNARQSHAMQPMPEGSGCSR